MASPHALRFTGLKAAAQLLTRATHGVVKGVNGMARAGCSREADSRVPTNALHPPTQPQRCVQHVVDARLPAVAGGAQRGQHIGVEPQFHGLLGGRSHRAAAADQLLALVQIGLLQPGFGDLQRIVRVNPRRCRWF